MVAEKCKKKLEVDELLVVSAVAYESDLDSQSHPFSPNEHMPYCKQGRFKRRSQSVSIAMTHNYKRIIILANYYRPGIDFDMNPNTITPVQPIHAHSCPSIFRMLFAFFMTLGLLMWLLSHFLFINCCCSLTCLPLHGLGTLDTHYGTLLSVFCST